MSSTLGPGSSRGCSLLSISLIDWTQFSLHAQHLVPDGPDFKLGMNGHLADMLESSAAYICKATGNVPTTKER